MAAVKRLENVVSRKTTRKHALLRVPQLQRLHKAGTLEFEIFDTQVKLTHDEVEVVDENTFVWTGSFAEGKGDAIFVRDKWGLGGTIWHGNKIYEVELLAGDIHVLTLFVPDPSIGAYGNIGSGNSGSSTSFDLPKLQENTQPVATLGNTTIDVLVAYTDDVAEKWGSNANYKIIEAKTATNQSYYNSGISAYLNVVHTVEVSYDETGSLLTDVDRFADPNDGYMDEIHDLRNQYKADVCVLIVKKGDDKGRVYAIPASEFFQAFCVVVYNYATGEYTFGHEIGHLQDARHQQSEDPAGSYNHGYPYPAGGWMTIMAFEAKAQNLKRIKYWSDYDQYYNGVRRGSDPNVEDNVRRLNETKSTVAGFSNDLPPWTPPSPPNPPTNFNITNAGVPYENPHMTWNAVSGATQYKVYRKAGSEPWENIATKTGTSHTDVMITITKPSDPNAVEFFYRVTALNAKGESNPSNSESIWGSGLYKSTSSDLAQLSEELTLYQNHPNPFNPQTRISYALHQPGDVTLHIFNTLGQQVANIDLGRQPAGEHHYDWQALSEAGELLASGSYYYQTVVRFENGQTHSFSRKMLLLR